MTRGNKLIKYFVVPGLLVAAFFLVRAWHLYGSENALVAALVLLLVCTALVIKKKPLYSFEQDYLKINGIINKRLPYASITEVRRIDASNIGWGMKIGLQVPGVRMGYFYFHSIGHALVNAASEHNMVLIRTSDNLQIIISVDDPDMFVEMLTNRIS